jgi:hypothetical protein
MTAETKQSARPFVPGVKTRRALLAIHLKRTGRPAIYCEKAYLLLVRLLDLGTRARVLEVELACRQVLGFAELETERFDVACHLDYLELNSLAVQATGYVPWILLTSPSRVQKVRQAVAAGMPASDLRMLVRQLARGG